MREIVHFLSLLITCNTQEANLKLDLIVLILHRLNKMYVYLGVVKIFRNHFLDNFYTPPLLSVLHIAIVSKLN